MDPSAAIWDSIKCLCGLLYNKAAYVYNLDENLQLLATEWEKLEAMKNDVHENFRGMQPSHQMSFWLKRVHTIQKKVKDIQVHGTKQIKNKCLSKCCPKNCKSSYKLGKDVAKILKNVDELQTEGETLCELFKSTFKPLCERNEMPCDETVGLDIMFGKVCKSVEEKDVGIIGLYGMGGVGKTTLLKKIRNELVKRPDFHVIWVVVSKNTNLDGIMDDIIKSVGIGDELWNHCTNQLEKAASMCRVLKEKKFVLLLDDIWERLDLEKMGVPHPKETNFQSKVLFTTRSKDVCAKMKAQKKFKVEILTEKEALGLFYMKVGEETLKSDPIIPKIAEEMAKECKGLPLALCVVGSAMAGVESVEAWQHSKNNLKSSAWTGSSLETEVFSVLKFSYDRLPDETHKKCFLYCALYPEDYEIRVYDLIEKWIGEGFLYNDGNRSVHAMRTHGGSIIEKLKLSCLLENVEDDLFLVRSIKMHDVVRDMALWIVRDEDKNKKKVIVQEDAWELSQDNVENFEMVERISIMNDAKSCMQNITWTNLITLSLKFVSEFDAIFGLQNIQYARRIKVLDICVPICMQPIPIPTEIGNLNLLEYLSLVGFGFRKESDISIYEWKNLKNLKILYLFLDGVIPLGLIPNLLQLKLFGFYEISVEDSDEREDEEFLEELERLSSLEELRMQIRTKSCLNILINSARLQSCMYGFELSKVRDTINLPLLLATMSKMKHLQRVHLFDLHLEIDPLVFDTCCLPTLRHITLIGCHTIHDLTWLKYAPLLQRLDVRFCDELEEVIKGGRIQEDEKDREPVIDSIFPSLVQLQLWGLPKLRSIHERALSFPSLRSIQVDDCGNLKKLPFDSNSGKATLKHIRGCQEWWDNLEWDDPAMKATFQSKFQESL